MGLKSGGLISERIFATRIWGAYFRKGSYVGGLIVNVTRIVIISSVAKQHEDKRKLGNKNWKP